jgi:hypothetical protein
MLTKAQIAEIQSHAKQTAGDFVEAYGVAWSRESKATSPYYSSTPSEYLDDSMDTFFECFPEDRELDVEDLSIAKLIFEKTVIINSFGLSPEADDDDDQCTGSAPLNEASIRLVNSVILSRIEDASILRAEEIA